jgi:tRNA dimethylallyltransferase
MFKVFVITGATASGKTRLAIELARELRCEIISADSRQIYRGIPIGTAAPTAEELAAVPHHLVGMLELDEYYSAAQFEADSLALIEDMKRRGLESVVVCGGSMMYIDALLRGLDDLPTISDEVRTAVFELYQQQGIDALIEELRLTDPQYLLKADLQNYRRLIHAVEITRQSGVPYSSLRTGRAKARPFQWVKYALDLPREVLFDRINRRVDLMMEQGLEQEARRVWPLRRLNSLNTVGYKEMFAYFEGTMDLPTATARIGKNTRVYAKKQLTWLRRDESVVWLRPGEFSVSSLSR